MTGPGPLADEWALLLAAAQQWLHRTVLDPSTARIATGDQACCWCPVCQLIGAVRGERPELIERWDEVQSAVAKLVRSAAETAASAAGHADSARDAAARESAGQEPEQQAAGQRSRLERIDLSGEGA
ncbi:MAG TPA: hypothetical protein VHO01_03715 [Jatrophihabitans sp.]|nr:hypothetical protein [Jatrophihabitans sp.]